jgi:hypothetical protein
LPSDAVDSLSFRSARRLPFVELASTTLLARRNLSPSLDHKSSRRACFEFKVVIERRIMRENKVNLFGSAFFHIEPKTVRGKQTQKKSPPHNAIRCNPGRALESECTFCSATRHVCGFMICIIYSTEDSRSRRALLRGDRRDATATRAGQNVAAFHMGTVQRARGEIKVD